MSMFFQVVWRDGINRRYCAMRICAFSETQLLAGVFLPRPYCVRRKEGSAVRVWDRLGQVSRPAAGMLEQKEDVWWKI